MKSLWPLVAGTVLMAGICAGFWALYVAGSVVGSGLEWCILTASSALYHLPSNLFALLGWIWAGFASFIANPLRAICTIIGMLLVLTYFRGAAGHFQEDTPLFRGSSVRTAEEIFPDFESDFANSPSMRGSSVGNADSLFEEPRESIWRRLWNRIKALNTRRFGGDDHL